jgi:hypothetical protein
LIGVVFATRIRDEDAAASMRAPVAPAVETVSEPSAEPAFAH